MLIQIGTADNDNSLFNHREKLYTVKTRVKSIYYSPTTRHKGAWLERRYSSYSFTTSALDGVSDQRHAPAALYPLEKESPIPIVQKAGWA
jgi:hypothetical protein